MLGNVTLRTKRGYGIIDEDSHYEEIFIEDKFENFILADVNMTREYYYTPI